MRTPGHALAVCLLASALVWIGCPAQSPPPPRPGLTPFEAVARVAVPGGWVSTTGGSLELSRRLLRIETRLGPLPLDGFYSSARKAWRWSFQLDLLDGQFVDASGAEYDVSTLADGAVVPGTDWIKLDPARMKTRGGLVYLFDGSGRLSAIHWSSDDYPRIHFVTGLVGAAVHVVAVEQCTAPASCAPVYDLSWSGAGQLAAIDDRAGRRAELSWDAAGRLVATRDAGDVADGLPGDRYDGSAEGLTSLVRSDGERTEYLYAGGRIAQVVSDAPGSPTHVFAYARLAPGSNRTVHVDPGGATTEFDWDDQRRLLRRTLTELQETIRRDWDGLRVSRVEGPDAVAIERTWAAGWLVSESLPSGNLRQFQWNPDGVNRLDPTAGAPVQASDDLGVLLAVAYDASGRPVELTDGVGDVTLFAWNGVELASIERPSGTIQTFESYGEHGFPTVIGQNGGIVDEPVYDAVGNRLRGRDLSDPTATSTPGVIERGFDADRRVSWLIVAEEDPSGAVTERTLRIHRRADGRPSWIERPYGGDTEYDYDALGRRIARRERVDGAWQTTFFEYDPVGRLAAEEKPNGMRRDWSFDAAGRPLTRTVSRGGVVESVLTSTWLDGRLVETYDSLRAGSEVYLYDTAGRVTRVIHAQGESRELLHDVRDRLTQVSLRWTDGSLLRTLAVEYDGADREVAIHDGGPAGPEVLGRSYALGRLVETRYGNGLRRHYEYGGTGDDWTGATTTAADGSFVADMVIAATGTAPLVVAGIITRTADPLGQVDPPPPGSAPGEVRTLENYLLYAGDGRPQGRRLRFEDTAGFLSVGGFTSYDALGNRLHALEPLEDDSFQERDFVYNAEHNRLLEVRRLVPDGSGGTVPQTTRSYTYDEAGYVTAIDGVPISWNGQGRVVAVGAGASFEWDAAGRPVSRTVMGQKTVHWFGGLVEAPAGETPRFLDLGEVRLDLVAGEHRYRHFGPRRNVKFETDAQGRVVAHHLYGPYGRLASYGPDPGDRGFAGGIHAAGFVVLGARILDPEAGRFLSPDPVETLLDAYAYTWGNPVELYDPAGLQGKPVPPGPPVAATVAQIFSDFSLVLGSIFLFAPAPTGPVLAGTFFLLGAALRGVSTGLRDDAARRGASAPASGGNFGALQVPAAGIDFETTCIDGFCFTNPKPPGSPVPPGVGPTPGGGSLGFEIGSAGCGAAPGGCALGPGLALLLPWLRRRRRRRWLRVRR